MRERKSVEFSGRNVEEAISRGLSELDLSRDDVEVHIISPGSRGVLGIGAENARVSLSYYGEAEQRPEPAVPTRAPVETPLPVAQEVPAPRSSESAAAPEYEEESPMVALDGEEFARAERLAADILENLLKYMSFQAKVVAMPPQGLMAEQSGKGQAIILDIRGDDLGILIGRRGETLSALQYLLRLMVSRETKQWLNILLDVEQYRIRRERGLRQLALRMAERAATTHQPVPLEAMTPYDRRVIHLTLRDHAQVTTKSIGEGENRKVVIFPVE